MSNKSQETRTMRFLRSNGLKSNVPRDRHFKLFVQSELLHGGQDKSEELRTLVWDQQVHIVEGPRYTKHNSMTGYSLSVETQEELELLLGVGAKISDEDGNETQVLMFQRMDNTKKEEEFERTVEVYGLPPRIRPDRIKSALIKYGEVERINVLPCAKGMKMKAAVVFKSMEAVDLNPQGQFAIHPYWKGLCSDLQDWARAD